MDEIDSERTLADEALARMRHVYDATEDKFTVLCACGAALEWPNLGDPTHVAWAERHANCSGEARP